MTQAVLVAGLLASGTPASDCETSLRALSLEAQHHPKDAGHWYQLGMCRAKSGFRKEAEDAFEKAVALSPNSGPGRYQLRLSHAMHSDDPGDWCRSSALWTVLFDIPEMQVPRIKPYLQRAR